MPLGVLSELPVAFDGPLPAFTPEGSLPPGDFRPTTREFESRFVHTNEATRRNAIYDGWKQHRDALLRAGLSARSRQLLDGSFTTTKPLPGDIDIAVEVPTDSAALMVMRDDHPVVRLLLGPTMKAAFRCDAYPIFSLPKDDPLYVAVTVRAVEYWTKWFGCTRAAIPKGRVWATTGGFHAG